MADLLPRRRKLLDPLESSVLGDQSDVQSPYRITQEPPTTVVGGSSFGIPRLRKRNMTRIGRMLLVVVLATGMFWAVSCGPKSGKSASGCCGVCGGTEKSEAVHKHETGTGACCGSPGAPGCCTKK